MTTSTAASSGELDNELRPAPTPPSPVNRLNRQRKIRFHHPGYQEQGQSLLLDLYAYDRDAGGLHYGTAFLACAIVAVNAFNGYLTDTRDGRKLDMGWDKLLVKSDYWFHVPSTGDDKLPYPVCPTFDHWPFPHGIMPEDWPEPSSADSNLAPPSASGLTNHVLRRDTQCLITSSKDYLETAHLSPLSDENWFKRNEMSRYNAKTDLINELDDVSNAIALRPDIHKAFDQRNFLIARKNSKWVVHFLQVTEELGDLYHNTPITINDGVSVFFLFARFAWAIFPSLRAFLNNGSSRRLCIRVGDQYSMRKEIRFARFEELQGFVNPPMSRKSSPTKRARSSSAGTAGSGEYVGYYTKKPRYASSEHTSESRGRKRHRTSSPEQTNILLSQFPTSSTTRVPSYDWEKDATELEKKRLDYMRAQRPQDPRIICCDYNEAERASSLGLPGKEEYGGGHLCLRCRGAESLEEMPESPDGWQNEGEREVAC